MDASKIREGNYVLVDGQPCLVLKFNLRQQPRLASKIITKLRNLLTGSVVEKIFNGGDSVPEADITTKKMKYLYNNGQNYVFMDNDTYDQIEISKEKLGDLTKLIIDDCDAFVQYFNNTPINVNLPPTMTLKVASTEPGVKGDTAGAAMKPATLETGLVVQVPLFINSDDSIVINTETLVYKERAKK